jgi:hypothetical protein
VKRNFLLTVLSIGVLAGTALAQQPSLPAPSPNDQTNKPRLKPPLVDEQRLNEAWAKMPVEAKSRLMRLHRALSEMPPEERKFVHDRIERFLNMSPAEREKLKQNRQRWEQMTPEERQKAREEFHKHSKEFEQQWHREHPGEDAPSTPENNATPPPASAPAQPSAP